MTCEFLQNPDRDLWQDAVKESRNRSLGAGAGVVQLAGGGELDDENNTPPGQSQKEPLADERPRKEAEGSNDSRRCCFACSREEGGRTAAQGVRLSRKELTML